jgi:hypothetical protein
MTPSGGRCGKWGVEHPAAVRPLASSRRHLDHTPHCLRCRVPRESQPISITKATPKPSRLPWSSCTQKSTTRDTSRPFPQTTKSKAPSSPRSCGQVRYHETLSADTHLELDFRLWYEQRCFLASSKSGSATILCRGANDEAQSATISTLVYVIADKYDIARLHEGLHLGIDLRLWYEQ